MGGFEVALSACFGVSIDVFPAFSYSYSALAVLVLVLEDTTSSPQISVCRLRFCWDFAAQDFPDAAGRIDFFQLVVTSFCIECPVGSLALAAVPRHPDPGFLEPKSRECNGQELIEYMAAGIY